jgi:hypothetical protein
MVEAMTVCERQIARTLPAEPRGTFGFEKHARLTMACALLGYDGVISNHEEDHAVRPAIEWSF